MSDPQRKMFVVQAEPCSDGGWCNDVLEWDYDTACYTCPGCLRNGYRVPLDSWMVSLEAEPTPTFAEWCASLGIDLATLDPRSSQ